MLRRLLPIALNDMPIDYRIDTKLGVIFTSANGVLTDQDLLQHKRRLLEDPQFRAGLAELSDVRNVDRLDVTPEGIRRFAQQDAADATTLGDYKLAIVASEPVVFGMARMYQARTSEALSNVMVFRTVSEARVWLAVPE